MKKILLALTTFVAVSVNAQIVNNDFENWAIDTIYFPGISTVPPDTFTASNPVLWTSSNSLTGADSLGGVFFVTQSSTAYSGSSAIKMKTDSLRIPLIPGAPASKLTIPGFAVNGKVPITANTLLTSGNTVTPMSVLGAGQPMTTKLGKIKGYFNYAPQSNGGGTIPDTCLVWATLRKGTTLIGEAIFKSTSNTNGNYQPFEASFNYLSCDDPDTLVILIASSVPNVAAILSGNSGLVAGSELLVDSIYYENLPGGYNFPPVAVNDLDTTTKNTAKNILIKLNDFDCNNPVPGLTIAVTSGPSNGTATVMAANAGITYTPANNFVGIDTVWYTLNDGSETSAPARIRILVLNTSSIEENKKIAVAVYPQPAGDVLNINFENNGSAEFTAYDIVGKMVLQQTLTSGNNTIQVSDLTNGVYAFRLTDEKGNLLASDKFTVNK